MSHTTRAAHVLYCWTTFATLIVTCAIWPLGDAVADDVLRIHMISGSAEYQSEASLKVFKQKLLSQYQHIEVTASWAEDEGTTLPNADAVAQADLLLIFTRRMTLPEEELAYILAHVEAEKPVLGIRTASHAFEGFTELDAQVFGGDYSGHGRDEPTRVEVADDAAEHPILQGVEPWSRPGKIYHNRNLGPHTQRLLEVRGQNSDIYEPVVWVNRYGSDAQARAFYTSLGFPHDFENETFVQMLLNAIAWCAERELVPVDE